MTQKLPNTGPRKPTRESFQTDEPEDQQVGTSQAQKGEGRKPSQSGKRESKKK